MKRTLFIMLLLVAPFVVNIGATKRVFIHPGSVLTKADLNRIKMHVNQKDEPWATCWKELQSSTYGNLSRVASPSTEIGGSNGNRQRASGDATAALIDAIEWHVTGQRRYADHAVKLLSAWGNKVETANAELFQFPSVTMSVAAKCFATKTARSMMVGLRTTLIIFLPWCATCFIPLVNHRQRIIR